MSERGTRSTTLVLPFLLFQSLTSFSGPLRGRDRDFHVGPLSPATPGGVPSYLGGGRGGGCGTSSRVEETRGVTVSDRTWTSVVNGVR